MALDAGDDEPEEEGDESPSLEMPPLASGGGIDSDKLWQYRARSVPEPRPILTGDVFFDVEVEGAEERPDGMIILQHPCALRSDGFELRPHVLVARVDPGIEMNELRHW